MLREPPAREPQLAPEWRARVLAPALVTADLPGIGGRIRTTLADFRVDEIPAYGADGSPGHLLLVLEKRGLATEEAIGMIARALAIHPRTIGYAGRKDAGAITRQWISVPAAATDALARFEHEAITLGPATPHSHKLRIGHLHGNRFDIVVRELAVDPETALARARAKLACIAERGGIPNAFGPQRFGRDGGGMDRGLEQMRRGRAGARANMTVASGQAALFNLWVELRTERGCMAAVLEGDVLAKVATGGLFTSTDPDVDGARLVAREVAITGPLYGSRTRMAPAGTPAAAIERDVLALAHIDESSLRALGRAALGTRRRLLVSPTDVDVAIDDLSGLGVGLRLRFTLPAGSFATQLVRELSMG
ncbi:MAG TPA: tRNA pseudouridine(13) synthase TruD [Nannocystaceae bacterium]|nr:tRNA pseudouridine(13) synthase TruD [Nannocystaceae bacterium]